ncbi:hypothetical protein J2S70_000087 [Trueperella bonasi]|uniref:Uncharacterized protein n=1 Tax=Trueperella bonasi TaxID=312286 RepID=A0ABT9NDN9_9ACTO|nr:hypothetical protein [Trueperella bonasi]
MILLLSEQETALLYVEIPHTSNLKVAPEGLTHLVDTNRIR